MRNSKSFEISGKLFSLKWWTIVRHDDVSNAMVGEYLIELRDNARSSGRSYYLYLWISNVTVQNYQEIVIRWQRATNLTCNVCQGALGIAETCIGSGREGFPTAWHAKQESILVLTSSSIPENHTFSLRSAFVLDEPWWLSSAMSTACCWRDFWISIRDPLKMILSFPTANSFLNRWYFPTLSTCHLLARIVARNACSSRSSFVASATSCSVIAFGTLCMVMKLILYTARPCSVAVSRCSLTDVLTRNLRDSLLRFYIWYETNRVANAVPIISWRLRCPITIDNLKRLVISDKREVATI